MASIRSRKISASIVVLLSSRACPSALSAAVGGEGLKASPAIPNLRCEFSFGACRLGLSRDGGSDMTAVHHPTDFICPGCGAGYKVVSVKRRPTSSADPLQSLQTVTGPHRQGIHFEILPD